MKARSILATAASLLLASTVFAGAQTMQKQAPGGAGEGAGEPTHMQREGQGKQPAPKSSHREEYQQNTGQMGEHEGGAPRSKGKQQTQTEPGGKQDTRDAGKSTDTKSKTGERKSNQKGEQRATETEHKTLTVKQKTKVRERVLHGSSAPRVTNVNFSIHVGTVVPRSVKAVALPPILVEYYPAYRGYLYFVADDEIIIVDRDHRIIAVIEV
jgi:Protein of unknown function (DUF1236)